ncbi:MAG: HAD family hydrolase [Chloroflexi bacterium]|nr:HAD family hydrolase [Chloroflexota bacterium]
MIPVRTVVFDWGDTVMRVFPECQGPMAHWPRVEAVPGVIETLQALHQRYCLVLATNAAESGASLVREALGRAGLEGCFDVILTAQELGARKPDPAFFQRVLAALNCTPGDAVVVGDDYQTDVIGAKEAGLRAIWFNPSGASCPLAHPLHDAEVRTMAELPTALENLFT